MRKLVAGVVMAAALMVAGTAEAGNYFFSVLSHTDMVAIDLDTIQVSGNVTAAWVTVASADPPMVLGKPIGSLTSRYEFDCRAGRFRTTQILALDLYSKHLYSDTDVSPWEFAVPDSAGSSLLKDVCFPDQRHDFKPIRADRKSLVDSYRDELAGKP